MEQHCIIGSTDLQARIVTATSATIDWVPSTTFCCWVRFNCNDDDDNETDFAFETISDSMVGSSGAADQKYCGVSDTLTLGSMLKNFRINTDEQSFLTNIRVTFEASSGSFEDIAIDNLTMSDGVPCLTSGPMIQKPNVPEASLQAGDLVITQVKAPRPLLCASTRLLNAPWRARYPVRKYGGALGKEAAERNMLVLPYLRMALTGWQEEKLFRTYTMVVAAWGDVFALIFEPMRFMMAGMRRAAKRVCGLQNRVWQL